MHDYLDKGVAALRNQYPDVAEKLALAEARLKSASREEDFQDIGLRCRDAMIIFANALFSPDFVPPGKRVPGKDDAKARIDHTVQFFGPMAGSDAFRDLTKAVWSQAMSLQHDRTSSEDEASRALMLTTVAILEVASLVNKATRNLEWVQVYGEYKCPVCGSSRLQEEDFGDFDGPTVMLTCTQCHWISETSRTFKLPGQRA